MHNYNRHSEYYCSFTATSTEGLTAICAAAFGLPNLTYLNLGPIYNDYRVLSEGAKKDGYC